METTNTPPPKKRNCNHCGKEYSFTKATSQYCTNICRSLASKANRSGLGNAPEASIEQPKFTAKPEYMNHAQGAFAIPPHAQMMIDHYKDESKRWEKKYDGEVADLKAAKSKIEDLQADLRNNEKPGGLNGFLGTEGGVEVAKVFAPILADFAKSRMNNGQIGGGSENPLTKHINSWFPTLSSEGQEVIANLFATLSQMDQEQMIYWVRGRMQST